MGFAPGKPELERTNGATAGAFAAPSRREIAVVRGWADSLALTAACHDAKLHNRLAPAAGPAREVFEAMERARVEAIGANRMKGMAEQSDRQARRSFRAWPVHSTSRTATRRRSSEALALIMRERLTGLAPHPTTRKPSSMCGGL